MTGRISIAVQGVCLAGVLGVATWLGIDKASEREDAAQQSVATYQPPSLPGTPGPLGTRTECDQFGNRIYINGNRYESIAVVGQDPTCRGGAR